ncbi:putative peroxidase [Lyophyllum shimeji]|uniref:Peroxidase n=1 Tax=Lyophyllum shimeji TaxID=47721 RepID=A0A9P3UT87_LYOSH|nr:putative peroxidase [Lyophyllum shimeji]
MSRPVSTVNGTNVKIVVPPGWTSIVTAVTRRTYNQLVLCEHDDGGAKTTLFANKWQTPDVTMLDISNNSSQLGVSPQAVAVNFSLQFYYSQTMSVNGAALRADQYKSNEVNVLTSEKPSGAPPEFPDYVSFIILVEDAPANEQVPGRPRFDDMVVTVHCMKNQESTTAPPVPAYNLSNIQGDILPALPKALEYFYYFEILNVEKFREAFGKFIVPKITTAQQLTTNPPPPPPNPSVTFLGVNAGFTYLALQLFGLTDDLLDDSFVKGQQQDSKDLGDAGTARGDFWTPKWDAEYKVDIHGIFLITAYNDAVAAKFVEDMERAFTYTATRMSIKKVVLLKGAPRAGAEARNDHFGYRGGMSNPQVRNVTFETPAQATIRYPGSPIIPIGVIVMGYEGDEDKDKRAAWAIDGSFMVTRKLNNLVPEFDDFLLEHGPKVFPNIPVKDAADRLGARLFGRWKDGTPTELSPDAPDPAISGDDKRINNFAFDQSAGQKRCPFASHMRKSNPRNDVTPVESVFKHFIRRHNMPYGPEVSPEERDGNGTIQERGLHVVCYASSIVRGFKFYQQAWYNEPNFPPNKPELPGMDPIFGQTGEEHLDVHRYMTGANPTAEQQVMSFPKKFIDPRVESTSLRRPSRL